MKMKSFTKIVSGILCAALTMQIGWSLKIDRVNADDNPTITYTGDATTGFDVTLDGDGGDGFYVTSNENVYTFTCIRFSQITESFSKINKLTVKGNSTAFLQTDLESELELIGAGSHFTIEEGSTFTCKGMSGDGWIQNSGTMIMGTYKPSDYPEMCLSNNNTFIADVIDLSNMTTIDFIYNTNASPSSFYYVNRSFSNSKYTLQGTVVAQPDTVISSDGGKFTLNVGVLTKEITGTFINASPAYLFKNDLNISLSQAPNVYYGTTYDFTQYISCDSDYNGNIQLQYSDDDINYHSSAPTSVGKHYVRAVAEETDDYKDATSASRSFNIDYLPNSEVDPEGKYFTLGNVVDGKYVNGTVTITPVSGYQILCSHATVPNKFFDSITLSEDQLFSNGSINTQVYFIFKRTGDDAETREIYATSISTPNIKDLVFDTSAPHFDAEIVDENGEHITETSVDGENVVIVADHLSISVWDDTLKTVKVDIDGTTTDYSNQISEEGYCEIILDGIAAKAQRIIITATDVFDKKSTAEFTLYHEPIEPTISLSAPETIYAGEDYDIDVKTNSDGKITYQYNYAYIDRILEGKPTEAGDYVVTVYVSETDFYHATEKTIYFSIIKRTPYLEIDEPETIIGEPYSIEFTTDSDGKSDAVIEYKLQDASDDSYSETQPTTAGAYTVRVTIPATVKFMGVTETFDYKIMRKNPTITLSVPDTTIDQAYAPVLETDSDSTKVVYEYKVQGANDSTYSTTKPTTAGSYTLRVTIPMTAKYNAASATADFKIGKKSPSVSLGVGTPYAGTTYTPAFASNSDGADKAVFEYKEKNADNSKYTTTAPTAYGDYVVRVTVPETATFAKVTATAEFSIIYLEAPQTAFVMEGTSGKNNYFTSDVVLKAPTGYTISAVYGGTYTASIPYTEGITSVYLKRTSDNALTSAIAINNKPKIDTQAPAFAMPTGNITPGSTMYVKDVNITVTDPNLKSLKVNGEAIDLTKNTGNVLTLSPGMGSKTFQIVAEDEAGNISSISFTLKAEWLEKKVIIPDVVLPLEGNESYNLGDGYWIVTRNTPEGPVTDNTVYSGNMPFYVEEGGEYTFTRVT